MTLSKAYIINLKHRKDRLQSITNECAKNQISMHRIDAVDGVKKYPNLHKRKAGIFGCYLSHISTLKMLQNEVEDYFLIAEDDCIFADDFKEKLENYSKQLPENWDMLYLGGSLRAKDAVENFTENLKRAKNVWCTHAYIVRKNSISGLIKKVETRQWKVDVLYCEYQKTHSCYITIPELAWQQAGFSDIELKETNNTHLKNLK